jgi:hypothetical protein
MYPTDYKIVVIIGLLSHEVVTGDTESEIEIELHDLREHEAGSRGDGTMRKKCGE